MHHKVVVFFCALLLAGLWIDRGSTAHADEACSGLTAGSGFFLSEATVSGGLERTYAVYVPTSYDAAVPTPLVFNFHGLQSNGLEQNWYSDMSAEAEQYGFILVYPNGVGNSWNGGGCCGEAVEQQIDDVGFTSDIIDVISSDYCIDSDRVYSTGVSNGGIMSYRLACELSDRITAVAAVSAPNLTFSCEPSRSLPLLVFAGTDDVFFSYASMRASAEDWASTNGCSTAESTVTYQQGAASCVTYDDCDENGDGAVEMCTIAGGGHNWPGAIDLFALDPQLYWWAGYTTQDIDASQAIWSFFSGYSM